MPDHPNTPAPTDTAPTHTDNATPVGATHTTPVDVTAPDDVATNAPHGHNTIPGHTADPTPPEPTAPDDTPRSPAADGTALDSGLQSHSSAPDIAIIDQAAPNRTVSDSSALDSSAPDRKLPHSTVPNSTVPNSTDLDVPHTSSAAPNRKLPSNPLTYNPLTLDRVPHLRTDPTWVHTQLARPDARVIRLHQGRILHIPSESPPQPTNPSATTDPTAPTRPSTSTGPTRPATTGVPVQPGPPTGPVTPTKPAGPIAAPRPTAPTSPLDPHTTVFLGLDGDTPVFATEIPEIPAPTGPTHDLRAIVTTLDPHEAATLAYARGMLHWTRNQRFCGTCGHPTTPQDGGHVRACTSCAKLHFPRIEPAVITLVTWQDTCLLGRHHGSDGYSTLAGFVEPGENLETAVRREIHEEAGVTLTDVHYRASQTWPFPSGLMIAFRAHAASPDIHVDHNELDDARWFTPDEVHAMPNPRTDSVEHFLITQWLDESTHR